MHAVVMHQLMLCCAVVNSAGSAAWLLLLIPYQLTFGISNGSGNCVGFKQLLILCLCFGRGLLSVGMRMHALWHCYLSAHACALLFFGQGSSVELCMHVQVWQ